MAFQRSESEPHWLPTHVQVTVLQARGLRAKGKQGTSDAYTIIQVGKEKYSTSVAEKSAGSAEWKEECSFELAVGALESRGSAAELQLTAMHRALIGMDKFLGQVSIPLGQVFSDSRSLKNQWYRLHSKPGQKEKERGEIQVSIQFTCNNMTASMFDLSMKDKHRTPFGKLKDKMKSKKKYDMESASAIVPSSVGRLNSDEEDQGERKSKSKGFFLKEKLRKSSLNSSNTSLGSESAFLSGSSSTNNNAGIPIVLPEVTKKPSQRNSSLSSYNFAKNEASPRLTHKRAFSDEASQVNALPQPKAISSLKPKSNPISKSSLCINGSHVYAEEPAPRSILNVLEKSSPVSRSLQNITKNSEEHAHTESIPAQPEITKWRQDSTENISRTPPSIAGQEDTKVSTNIGVFKKHENESKAMDNRLEAKPVQIAMPMIFSGESKEKPQEDTKREDKRSKMSLFHHGSGKGDSGTKSLGEKMGLSQTHSASSQVVSNPEERSKASSWFASKDATHKPSFHSGSHATAEAAESISLFEDYYLPASTSSKEKERENESSSPGSSSASQGFMPFQELNPFAAALTSDTDSFVSFATSRLQGEVNGQRQLSSLTSECVLKVSSTGSHHSLNASKILEKIPQEFVGIKENECEETKTPKLQGIDELPIAPESYSEVTSMQITETVLPDTPPVVHISASSLVENDQPKVLQIASARLKPLQETEDQVILTPQDGLNVSEGEQSSGENQLGQQASPKVVLSKETDLTGLPKLAQSVSLGAPVRAISENKPENRICAISPLVLKVQMAEALPVTVYPCVSEAHIRLNNIGSRSFRKIEAAVGTTAMNSAPETSTFELQSLVVSENASPELCTHSSEVNIPQETEAFEKERDIKRDLGKKLETDSEAVMGTLMLPPKFPRCFTSFASEDKDVKTDLDEQTSDQDKWEEAKGEKQVENPKEKVEKQNITTNRERISLVAPNPPVFEAIIEARSGRLSSISEDTESTTEGITCNLEERDNELQRQAISNEENLLDINETTEAEQFKTCPSKFSLERLDILSAEENSNKLDVFKHDPDPDLIIDNQIKLVKLDDSGERKNLEMNFVNSSSLTINGRDNIQEEHNTRKKNDSSDFIFWSALEEEQQSPTKYITDLYQNYQNRCDEIISEDLGSNAVLKDNHLYSCKCEEGDHIKTQDSKTHVQTIEHKTYSPDVSVDSKLGLEQPVSEYVEEFVGKSRSSPSQKSGLSVDLDFKNANFWRLESDLGELDLNKGDTPVLMNPFTPADGAPFPSQNNPFVERTFIVSSTHPILSDIFFQEDSGFKNLYPKTTPQGTLPANLLEDQQLASSLLRDSQPLAFSTPSMVVSESDKIFNFPSPSMLCSTYGPPLTTNTAAFSSHLSPVSDVKASGLTVLPQERQSAEKVSLQQRISPHPVKPISAAISENASDKKQKSLATALSSGLEKLKNCYYRLCPASSHGIQWTGRRNQKA
ncbi:rab11 family-interacting protein 5 [Microcaecilia unicolor]|uniref:Rab11 family-interacting protein 5 n=1 Tax=Microcaecilia unicolor TaxID=1415580 RepID=A0A6P7X0B5_9AMPH|nr:rab11 family-interacting protein 5 [Microcaecilia unicolor]